MKRDLDQVITVTFGPLDQTTSFSAPCEKKDVPQLYGSVGRNEVRLNQNFLPLLGQKISFSCGHKNWDEQALATLLHETTHLWEEKMGKPSDKRAYTYLAYGQMKIFGRNMIKNTTAIRSPDAYELKNTAEHFAVNVEYFLLDPEYTCRRPNLSRYFQEIFEVSKPACEPQRFLMLSGNKGPVRFDLTLENVKEIHFLEASRGKETVSRFGHAMIRLVTKDARQDIVVGFVAQVNSLVSDSIKGLTGKYPSKMFVAPLSQTMEDYNKTQFRDLNSFPLKLTDLEKQSILDEILSTYWEYSGKYYFITNNCADEALNLLKRSLLLKPLLRKQVTTPTGLRHALAKLDLLDENRFTLFPSYETTQKKIFTKLSPVVAMTMDEWQQTDALTRMKVYTSMDLKKEALLAALSFEVSIKRNQLLELEKSIGSAIYKLNDGDPMKTLALESMKLQGELDFGKRIEKGYGIPVENDFSAVTIDMSSIQKRLSEVKSLMATWALAQFPVKDEFVQIQTNQDFLKEKILTSITN